MAGNILVLRWFFLPLFLFGFWGCTYAGADPTPTDWLPRFYKIALDGSDVVIDSKITQIRLHNGQWENNSSSPINMLVQKQTDYFPRTESCSVPKEVLHRYENGYGHISIVSCDLPERIWFASGGYCGEGDDDPLYNQGQLYSYSPANGKVQEYRGFLPKCAEVAGMARINNKLVLATVYQGEYSLGPGKVLLFNLDDVKAHSKVLTNPHPTGAALAMSAYDSQCDCLWFATEEGVERLKVSEGKWEQRYLDYEITPDNKFVLTLSSKKPSDEKMWLGRLLYSYPIEDLRGFLTAWNQSPASQYDRPRVGPLLLPFYIAAIERTKEGWTDWSFAGLMHIVAAYQDNESRQKARAFIEKLLKQPMNLSRRKEVVSAAKEFGIDEALELEEVYFDDLLKNYFSRLEPNQSYDTDAVRIAFEHPEYLPKLRDYYLTHPVSFHVENSFIERATQYRFWKGYDIIAPAIEDGRKHYEHRFELLNICARLESKLDDSLLPLLQARMETDVQANLSVEKRYIPSLNSTGGNPETYALARSDAVFHTKATNFSSMETSCIDASYYWINYGGVAKVDSRVGVLLNVVAAHKKLSPIALDVLNYRFTTQFNDIEEWKSWWTINKGIGPVTIEMHKHFPNAELIQQKLIEKGFRQKLTLFDNEFLPAKLTIQIGSKVDVGSAQRIIETVLKFGPKDIGIVVMPKDSLSYYDLRIVIGRNPAGNYRVYVGDSIQYFLSPALTQEDFEKFAKLIEPETSALDCSKKLTECRNRVGSCVSMTVDASTCDRDCQVKVLEKLYSVGVSAHTHTYAMNHYSCVGYRKDIIGTEEGAKCIAKLLGYEYDPVGCNVDGYPYSVWVR